MFTPVELVKKSQILHDRIQKYLLNAKHNNLVNKIVTPVQYAADYLHKALGSLVFWKHSYKPSPQNSWQQQDQEINSQTLKMEPEMDKQSTKEELSIFFPPPLSDFSNQVPIVDEAKCTGCGECVDVCGVEAITIEKVAKIDAEKCFLCGACVAVCAEQAVGMPE